jgi:hypothetical protein
MGRARRTMCKGGQRKKRPSNMSRQGMPKTYPANCYMPAVESKRKIL